MRKELNTMNNTEIYYTNLIITILANNQNNEAEKDKLREMYLDYLNNFITQDNWREHYGILDYVSLGNALINLGRKLQEEYAEECKKNI